MGNTVQQHSLATQTWDTINQILVKSQLHAIWVSAVAVDQPPLQHMLI